MRNHKKGRVYRCRFCGDVVNLSHVAFLRCLPHLEAHAAKRRLQRRATVGLVAAGFVAFALIPLGVWS